MLSDNTPSESIHSTEEQDNTELSEPLVDYDQTGFVSDIARSGTLGELRNILLKQEDTRSRLAFLLTGIFAIAVALTFLYIFISPFLPVVQGCEQVQDNVTVCSPDTDAKDLITFTLSSLTTILATAIGFYFGSKSDK